MHSVCRCSLPVWRRSFLKKGTPCDLFWPCPGSAIGGIWPKNNNTCKGPWVLHPYQVSSKSIKRFWRRSRKCEKFTPDGRTDGGTDDDDGRTDDGRCAMTIAHSSLRLRWAKNLAILLQGKALFLDWNPYHRIWILGFTLWEAVVRPLLLILMLMKDAGKGMGGGRVKAAKMVT